MMSLGLRRNITVVLGLWLVLVSATAGCSKSVEQHQEKPLLVILLVDTSRSMVKFKRELNAALIEVLDSLRPGDIVLPATFDTYASSIKDREGKPLVVEIRDGEDRMRLRRALQSLRLEGEWSYYMGALEYGVRSIEKWTVTTDKDVQPVLLIVGDGVLEAGPGRSSDLSQEKMAKLYERHPRMNRIKVYMLQLNTMIQTGAGREDIRDVVSRLPRKPIDVFTLNGGGSRASSLTTTIAHMMSLGRASAEEQPSGPSGPNTFNLKAWIPWLWNRVVEIGLESPEVVILGVFGLLGVFGTILIVLQRSRKRAPSSEEEQEDEEEPKKALIAVVSLTQRFQEKLEHEEQFEFVVPEEGRVLKVGSSPEKNHIHVLNDPDVKPMHLVISISPDGTIRYRTTSRLNVRPFTRPWQPLWDGLSLSLSRVSSLKVALRLDDQGASDEGEAEWTL